MLDSLAKISIMPPMKIINPWPLVGEIGFLIALPLAVSVPLAVKLDKHLETIPLFIMGSFILSMIVSSIAVVRRVKSLSSRI